MCGGFSFAVDLFPLTWWLACCILLLLRRRFLLGD
jgi:hypothetical protein